MKKSLFWQIILLAFIYYAAGRLGQLVALNPGFVTPIWPASGVALAALILYGYRLWPGVLLGSLFNNFLIFVDPIHDISFATFFSSALIGVGASLEALVGAWLFLRFLNSKRPFDAPENIIKFFIIASVSCLINSNIGQLGLILSSEELVNQYSQVWWTWWIGDLAGILIFTPLILSWSSSPSFNTRKLLEGAILVTMMLLVMESLFMTKWPLLHVTMIFVIWIGFRFGFAGATLILLIMNAFAVVQTTLGHGPFVLSTLNISLIMLESFIFVPTLITLLLISFVKQRNKNEELLKEYNRSLERTVTTQSVDLKEKQNLVRDRERKIKSQHRLAFLGEVSRGVAFEILNPLQGISKLLKNNKAILHSLLNDFEKKSDDPNLQELQQKIETLNVDMKKIDQCEIKIEQLLSEYLVSKKPYQTHFQKIDVNLLIDDYIRFASHEGEPLFGIKIKKDFDPSITSLEASPQELLHVLFNILKNSSEAVIDKATKLGYENYTPEIFINTRMMGSKVAITIWDNGIGIKKEFLKKIYTPFNSHHAAGTMGLGLSVCKDLIENVLKGRITIESEEGKFTEVSILIPVKQPISLVGNRV